MLILFIYLLNSLITEMVFSSSQELDFHITFVSLLENLGPTLGIFKGIDLARWVFKRKNILFTTSEKGKWV